MLQQSIWQWGSGEENYISGFNKSELNYLKKTKSEALQSTD